MDTVFMRSVIFLTVVYVSSDILECKDLRRYDIHRIVFKPRNKERYKKPQHLRPLRHYQLPKKHFESSYDLPGESSSINKLILANHSYDYRRRYRNHNRSKKNKNNSEDINLKFHNYPQFAANTGNFHNFEEPISNYATTYDGFQQFQDITNYYNTKRKEKYGKHILERQKESDEVSSQEESNENANEGIRDFNEFEVIWNPMTNTKKYRSKSSKYNKKPKYNVNIGVESNGIGYVVDLTTSKPQKLPATIIEDDVYSNHNSRENLLDESQTSEEIYEETNAVPFAIDDFQNNVPLKNTYSTIWNPNYSHVSNLKRRRITKPINKVRLKSIRRSAYPDK